MLQSLGYGGNVSKIQQNIEMYSYNMYTQANPDKIQTAMVIFDKIWSPKIEPKSIPFYFNEIKRRNHKESGQIVKNYYSIWELTLDTEFEIQACESMLMNALMIRSHTMHSG